MFNISILIIIHTNKDQHKNYYYYEFSKNFFEHVGSSFLFPQVRSINLMNRREKRDATNEMQIRKGGGGFVDAMLVKELIINERTL
jgi:hypothetical protein